MFKRTLTAFAISATLLLSACESSEEKAESYYQSGLELLAAGDPARAAVEFRNVFRYNGEHQDARRQLADILVAQGKTSDAYSQYLRLAEQYPELIDVRQSMAKLAIAAQNWEQAERQGRKAIELAPDAPISESIRVSLDYRNAALEKETARAEALAAEAQALVEIDPLDILSRRVVIGNYLLQGRPAALLDDVDIAISQYPDDLNYYVIKLQALEALQDDYEMEVLLHQMAKQFPENTEVQQTLISFYLQRENFDGAEAFLRELAGDETSDPVGFMPILQLIERAHGQDAAKSELHRLVGVNNQVPENVSFYRAMLASYAFNDGDREQAIGDLQDILRNAPETDQTRRIKGTLATMLLSMGNQVGSRALVEEILAEDNSNVTALKLRARMLIVADQPGEAIGDLRRALDQSPRDTSIILLLANAHERNGSSELQGERLATAVEVSKSGPRESMLYVNYLLKQDRRGPARSVLADSRSANPTNVTILAQSARLAMADNALGVVRGIMADLEQMQDDERAVQLLQSLRTATLLQQDRVDEGLALLHQQAGTSGENTSAVFAIIQTQLRSGKLDEARAYLDSLLATQGDNVNFRLINAALLLAEDKPEESEIVLRELVQQNPDNTTAVSQLYLQLLRNGKKLDARAILDAGVLANPEDGRLLLYQAAELERDGQVDLAIEIYEKLYARNSNDMTVANNLASLLSGFRDDEETLTRAAAVARRLRGTDVPAFQDTYGWIVHRKGEHKEAVSYLISAAKGLPADPLVRYHLGMVYAALDRKEDAIAELTRAIEIAGPQTNLPQIKTAAETLAKLQEN